MTTRTNIVPVSGGKDSQAVLAMIIDEFGHDGLRVVHQFTGYDHPNTYAHMHYMAERYKVKIEFTKNERFTDIFDLIKKEGNFFNNKARDCTKQLKVIPFKKWLIANAFPAVHVFMGMRTAESAARASQYGQLAPEDIFSLYELNADYTKRLSYVTVSLPIVQWTTPAVFEYLAKRGDKVNPLYATGHTRVGCYPCLLAGQKEWKLAARDKVGQEHIDKLLEIERDFAKNGSPTGRKLIRIHETRDIEALRRTGNFQGHGSLFEDDDAGGCSICSI
jgi:3'-phosphoadenosine 5'-phosphosulfate sulfotransferase (PAPS reductase)/FAD synthetase